MDAVENVCVENVCVDGCEEERNVADSMKQKCQGQVVKTCVAISIYVLFCIVSISIFLWSQKLCPTTT